MSLWLQILSCQLPAGPRRRWGFLPSRFLPLFLSTSLSLIPISFSLPISHSPLSSSIYFSSIIPLPFHYVSPSLSPPSFPHFSSTSLPLGLILYLPTGVFPSFLFFSLCLVLCKENFHVTLTGNTAVSQNVTRMPGCRTKKDVLSPSPNGKNLMFKIFFDSSGLVYNANF